MIAGHDEDAVLRAVYKTAGEFGFAVFQADLQDPTDDPVGAHVVVFLLKPPWWRMLRPRRRGRAFGCAVSARLPGLRVHVLLVD